MKLFTDYLRENYSSKTINNYLYGVQKYLSYLGTDGSQESQLDILHYIGFLREQNLHPKTIRNQLYCIKIYYHYLQQSGQRQDHPCRNLTLRDQINRSIILESLYTIDQMEQFLAEHRSTHSILQRRTEVIISLLIYQALTNAEIVNLNLDDVDLEQGQIQINSLSTGAKNINASRTLALKSKQILLIDRYIQQDRFNLIARNKEPMAEDTQALLLTLFGQKINPGAIARQINSGQEKFMRMTPIKMRQSVIHHKLKEGHNVRVVQSFAGHRSILSTEEYQINKLEELKQGINKYHPLQ